MTLVPPEFTSLWGLPSSVFIWKPTKESSPNTHDNEGPLSALLRLRECSSLMPVYFRDVANRHREITPLLEGGH